MGSITINVKSNIGRELKEQGRKVVELTQRELDKISKDGLTYAVDLINNAQYDGDPGEATIYRDVSARNRWTITMKGLVAFVIEYGASRSRDHWVFTRQDRDIHLNAGGKKLERRYQKSLRSRTYIDNWGIRRPYAPDERPLADVKGLGFESFYQPPPDGNPDPRVRTVTVDGRRLRVAYYRPLKRLSLWGPRGEDEKRGVGHVKLYAMRKDQPYYTEGNPPNHIIEKTVRYMADNVDKFAKRMK